MEKVHLHEVGALDSIIDIVGTVFAHRVSRRGARRGVAAQRRRRHGAGRRTALFPVPAPATVRLLGEAHLQRGVQMEMLTPTGALILTEYADSYGPMPAMKT